MHFKENVDATFLDRDGWGLSNISKNKYVALEVESSESARILATGGTLRNFWNMEHQNGLERDGDPMRNAMHLISASNSFKPISERVQRRLEHYSSQLNLGEDTVEKTAPRALECWNVHSDSFNSAVGAVIMLNAVTIGLETDMPGSRVFDVAAHIFNAFFLFEMLIRLHQTGREYFHDHWNWFDCSLVVAGTVDLWLIPLLYSKVHSRAVALMRLLRILRILRVVRIFRLFRELMLIAKAFVNAFSSVCWIGILVVIVDYICAVFLTRIIGHSADTYWDGEQKDQIEMWFGSIGRSMYTLFMVMTLADWQNVCNVVMAQFPIVVVFFMAYILIASYTLVSLITGVISESLISAQREDHDHKMAAVEQSRTELISVLKGIFNDMDVDQSGTVSKGEIEEVFQDLKLVTKLEVLDIGCTSHDELMEMFDRIHQSNPDSKSDTFGEPEIPIDEFVDALVSLRGQASMKELFLVRQDVRQLANRQKEMYEAQRDMDAKLDKVIELLTDKRQSVNG